ncbi:FecR family protein [Bacteroides caecimuris]|uniref:FecR family protein n=1 Tax=Bacteroides caecimuris TaxID=1796613 RepID=A0A1C7H4A3_9BACE|nr:FecR family protein [Bacteroides caecimuris]ANU58711.1 hypothetical protein A4V03_15015 [Bacteroides caecimuris]OXE62604.1 hypothetical protein ADH74_14575 [Bacteroides caecimuris]QQR16374.1 FecR family protein [Bacteroides caecimuris]TGY32900.1 FecR family protein [Bacteroides caecimuris]UQA29342.1 FecR family protein [Bacteroides caecimuris]
MNTNIDLNEVKRLLLKKLSNSLSETEEQLLNQWINTSPQNRALAQKIHSSFFLTHAILDENELSYRNSWQRLRHNIKYTQHFLIRSPQYKWLVATILTGLILAGSYLFGNFQTKEITITAGTSKAVLYTPSSEEEYTLPQTENQVLNYSQFINKINRQKSIALSPDLYHTITVPRGGEYLLLLEDSTLIHLGPESSLTIPANFSRTNRTVNLSGEAYAIVYKDSLHPFTIQTEKVDIHVLGTKLNIEAYDDEKYVKVTLEEGKAELHSAKEFQMLPIGYTASIGEDKHIVLSKANIYECTAWHYNRLSFDNQTLENIMKKLERWYNIEVAYSSDNIRNFHITMDINKYESFNKLAQAIEKMNELKIQIKKNKVVLISERNLNQE